MAESVEQLRNTYPLGARVRLTDESVGTVRYVGEVSARCFAICAYLNPPRASNPV